MSVSYNTTSAFSVEHVGGKHSTGEDSGSRGDNIMGSADACERPFLGRAIGLLVVVFGGIFQLAILDSGVGGGSFFLTSTTAESGIAGWSSTSTVFLADETSFSGLWLGGLLGSGGE